VEVSYRILEDAAEVQEDSWPDRAHREANHNEPTEALPWMSDTVLLVKVAASRDECDREHYLRVRYRDQTGRLIALWSESFAVPGGAEANLEHAPLVTEFELAGVPRAKGDDYRFEIYVDEKHLQSIRLSSRGPRSVERLPL
jgi:hypothetical protein